jgi:hypothetical protein
LLSILFFFIKKKKMDLSEPTTRTALHRLPLARLKALAAEKGIDTSGFRLRKQYIAELTQVLGLGRTRPASLQKLTKSQLFALLTTNAIPYGRTAKKAQLVTLLHQRGIDAPGDPDVPVSYADLRRLSVARMKILWRRELEGPTPRSKPALLRGLSVRFFPAPAPRSISELEKYPKTTLELLYAHSGLENEPHPSSKKDLVGVLSRHLFPAMVVAAEEQQKHDEEKKEWAEWVEEDPLSKTVDKIRKMLRAHGIHVALPTRKADLIELFTKARCSTSSLFTPCRDDEVCDLRNFLCRDAGNIPEKLARGVERFEHNGKSFVGTREQIDSLRRLVFREQGVEEQKGREEEQVVRPSSEERGSIRSEEEEEEPVRAPPAPSAVSSIFEEEGEEDVETIGSSSSGDDDKKERDLLLGKDPEEVKRMLLACLGLQEAEEEQDEAEIVGYPEGI